MSITCTEYYKQAETAESVPSLLHLLRRRRFPSIFDLIKDFQLLLDTTIHNASSDNNINCSCHPLDGWTIRLRSGQTSSRAFTVHERPRKYKRRSKGQQLSKAETSKDRNDFWRQGWKQGEHPAIAGGQCEPGHGDQKTDPKWVNPIGVPSTGCSQ